MRIALHYKKIPFEYRAVNIAKDFHLNSSYSLMNPMHAVPALVVQGTVLTQSTAIIELLDDLYPERPLLPEDPFSRFKVRELCALISNDMQPLGNRRVLKHVARLGAAAAAAPSSSPSLPLQTNEASVARAAGAARVAAWQAEFIGGGLSGLEALLSRSAGVYSVGDSVTMADALLVPQVANVRRANIDLSAYPTITRVDGALRALPEFQKAAPEAQPDAEATPK